MQVYNGRPENTDGRSPKEINAYDLLDNLGIAYSRVDHLPAMTMEACVDIDSHLGTSMCKNLFLCNRQKTEFYLVMMPGEKALRTKDISSQLDTSRLSFADAELMGELVGTTPGSLTVLDLMDDTENRVQLVIDEEILSAEYVGCHPRANTSSLKIKMSDLIEKLLPALGHHYITVRL